MSKILELIILDRIEKCLLTQSNQFGFKRKHGTDQCIFAFKEIIDMYTSLNSRVSVCFLDASKAFDRINHSKLFNKLIKRGVCGYLLRIIIYWYETQTMCVRWGNITSGSFMVSNGVRQGGILSPLFFNIYIDDLSVQLNKLNIGCVSYNMLINHLMYADDLVLISPSTAGLQKLLDICKKFGLDHDIIFNPKKSAVMLFKPNDSVQLNSPISTLNPEPVNVVHEYSYLGYIICDDLSDEKDIDRQKRKLYGQGNTIIRKFSMCTLDVKIKLFKTYCTPMYCAQLWCRFKPRSNRKGALSKLFVAYHNILKLLIGVSKFERNSPICAYLNVPTCAAVIRNLIYRFKCRVENSENDILQALISGHWYRSCLRSKWRELTYVNP